MGEPATSKAARYDRLAPDSVSDFGQKVERMDREDLKKYRRETGRHSRFHTIPDLPWHKAEEAPPDDKEPQLATHSNPDHD